MSKDKPSVVDGPTKQQLTLNPSFGLTVNFVKNLKMPFKSLVIKKLTKILKILKILKIGAFWGFFGLFWGCFGLFWGFLGDFWRIFSGYPLFLGISVRISSGYPLDKIRMKNRPKIRKIRRFWSGFRKIRIHPLVGTPGGYIKWFTNCF